MLSLRESLIELRVELVKDVGYATTRDQHIRALQHIAHLDQIISDLDAE